MCRFACVCRFNCNLENDNYVINGNIITGVKRTKAVGQCGLSHAVFTLVLASPQVKVADVLSNPITHT